MTVRDHRIVVPVDREHPDRFGTTNVFAREVVDSAKDKDDLPLLLFLQGGPGGMAARPMPGGGWWSTVLRTHRLVLLDQRGTGRSGRIDARALAAWDPATAADRLACYRQDAIVEDAEELRRQVFGGRTWATLGQSYGGFLTLTYLSRHPEALTACYVTGGLIGLTATAEDVYARTFPRQQRRADAFYAAFPDDEATLAALADQATAGELRAADGRAIDPRRIQLLGGSLGMSTGAADLHWLLDNALDEDGRASEAFVSELLHRTGFDSNPLYAVLQEAIYHQGERVGGWAAQAELTRWPSFGSSARPVGLLGEAFFPWVYDEVAALRPFARVADELAERTHWPAVYDVERLASNEVPVAAVQYVDDPYVDLDLATATARSVGNARLWVTNEYLHDGLRAAGGTILPRLMDLAADRWWTTGP